MTRERRWRCKECSVANPESKMLTAPSPFDASATLTACPSCKTCDEGFELLCDEPGCDREAGCGWPTGDANDEWGGYRNTCFNHWRQG